MSLSEEQQADLQCGCFRCNPFLCVESLWVSPPFLYLCIVCECLRVWMYPFATDTPRWAVYEIWNPVKFFSFFEVFIFTVHPDFFYLKQRLGESKNDYASIFFCLRVFLGYSSSSASSCLCQHICFYYLRRPLNTLRRYQPPRQSVVSPPHINIMYTWVYVCVCVSVFGTSRKWYL